MKSYLLYGLIICLSIVGQTTNAQSQEITSPKGARIMKGGCSSEVCFGRESIFLFEDGNCVRRSIDEEEDRLCYFGTWKMEDSVIKMHYTTRYYGKPIGEIIYDSGRGHERHSLYTAVRENINVYDSIDWNEGQRRFDLIADGKEKYRAEFSQYNFLSTEISVDKQKMFSEQYLMTLNKQELRLLRNEIFAKYGLKFSAADLRKHFEEILFYYDGFYNDVTAFLNEYDKQNIELIKKYEAISGK